MGTCDFMLCAASGSYLVVRCCLPTLHSAIPSVAAIVVVTAQATPTAILGATGAAIVIVIVAANHGFTDAVAVAVAPCEATTLCSCIGRGNGHY